MLPCNDPSYLYISLKDLLTHFHTCKEYLKESKEAGLASVVFMKPIK